MWLRVWSQLAEYEFQLYYLLALYPGEKLLNFLVTQFLICKLRIRIMYTL